jgi:hypothetical protein
MPDAHALVYTPSDPTVRANPYPLLARLRAEDPVHWSPSLKSWVLTRYDDVRRVALSETMSCERMAAFYGMLPGPEQQRMTEVIRYLGHWLPFRDPPEHRRLRRLLQLAFTPQTVRRLEPRIREIVDELLGALAGGAPVDLVAAVAVPLPAMVIMELMGVPRARMEDVKRWSDDLAVFIGSARDVPDKYARAERGTLEMAAYFRSLIAERRAEPRDDFVSRMIAARDQGDALSEDELVASCLLMLFAGHETTTFLISNGVLLLLARRTELERLRASPGLAELAVEEILRMDGPINAICRTVLADHEIAGRRLRAGERVFAIVAAANRDPEQFEDPDRLDVSRAPKGHLTFGHGIHFCLGAPLARLEGQICLAEIARRFPGIALAGPAPTWIDSMILRGATSVMVRT